MDTQLILEKDRRHVAGASAISLKVRWTPYSVSIRGCRAEFAFVNKKTNCVGSMGVAVDEKDKRFVCGSFLVTCCILRMRIAARTGGRVGGEGERAGHQRAAVPLQDAPGAPAAARGHRARVRGRGTVKGVGMSGSSGVGESEEGADGLVGTVKSGV